MSNTAAMPIPSNATLSAVPQAAALVLVGLAALSGCSSPTTSTPPTYYRDAKPIIDARCATCHRPGDIGPFPLTSFSEVSKFAGAARASIASGSMPPWQPSDDCNTYAGNFDLTPEERTTLFAWFDAGAPEGAPADARAQPPPQAFETDIRLQLPEPYAPTREPDDYRCQLIPWLASETRFVTGVRVKPDRRALVHHVIVYLVTADQAAKFRAYDDAEAGPGYTCYGGPQASSASGGLTGIEPQRLLAALQKLGLTLDDIRSKRITEAQFMALAAELGREPGSFRSIGSWVPGAPPSPFPSGTGIRVEPGSVIVAQVHYNTSSADPTPDQSVIELATTGVVQREAILMQALDLGWVSNGIIGQPMTIPAGAANVEHSTSLGFDSTFINLARRNLGLPETAPLVIHTANHHMHERGARQRTELRRADGSTTCVLDIPDWDFHWQGSYTLNTPLTMRAGDQLWMGCTWDNSAANQPLIGGVPATPTNLVGRGNLRRDVPWWVLRDGGIARALFIRPGGPAQREPQL